MLGVWRIRLNGTVQGSLGYKSTMPCFTSNKNSNQIFKLYTFTTNNVHPHFLRILKFHTFSYIFQIHLVFFPTNSRKTRCFCNKNLPHGFNGPSSTMELLKGSGSFVTSKTGRKWPSSGPEASKFLMCQTVLGCPAGTGKKNSMTQSYSPGSLTVRLWKKSGLEGQLLSFWVPGVPF